MDTIKLLEYKEGNFLLKSTSENDKPQAIQLSLQPVIYWSEIRNDIIAFRIESIVMDGDHELLKYDSTQIYQVDYLSKSVQFQQDKFENSPLAKYLVAMAINFYRGAFTARLRDTVLSNTYFPVLDAVEFIKNCKIVKLPNQ